MSSINAFAVALMAVLLVAIPSIEAVPQEWRFARFPVTFILFFCIKYDPRINTPKKTADGGSPGRAWSAIPGVLFSLRVPLVVLAVLYGALYIWLKSSRDIHLLVRAADAKGISSLLASGADPDRRDGRGRCSRQGEPPEGCRFPDMEGTAALLLEAGGDVNAKSSIGETFLFYVDYFLKNRDADKAFAFLLERGADADAKDSLGNTPLHRLVQSHTLLHIHEFVKTGDSAAPAALLLS